LMFIKPPVIQGIGSAGGFRMMLEDTSGKGYRAMQDVANQVIAKANAQPGLAGVYTFFDTGTPRVKTTIDREKAEMLGVAPADIFDTLSVYLGSAFV
ncbi:efflux RND transporter permease subunit, partial [Acinetobacter baumannii]